MRRGSRGRAAIALLGGLLSLVSPVAGQEVSLPPDLQLGLITKILTFDRQLTRYGPELVLGVAFQPRNRESAQARNDIFQSVEAAGRIRVGDMPLRVVEVPIEGGRLPEDVVRPVDVLYLAPVRGIDVSVLLAQAGSRGILTVTATPDEATSGAAVALLLRDTQPHIRIDLRAARLAGADLSSRLLRLAEVRR